MKNGSPVAVAEGRVGGELLQEAMRRKDMNAAEQTFAALAAGPPSVVLSTADPNRANDVLAVLRSRGHGAHAFDDEGDLPPGYDPVF